MAFPLAFKKTEFGSHHLSELLSYFLKVVFPFYSSDSDLVFFVKIFSSFLLCPLMVCILSPLLVGIQILPIANRNSIIVPRTVLSQKTIQLLGLLPQKVIDFKIFAIGFDKNRGENYGIIGRLEGAGDHLLLFN